MIVIHLIKLTPCLTPRILTNTMNPMMIKRNKLVPVNYKNGKHGSHRISNYIHQRSTSQDTPTKKYNQLMI